MAPSLIPIPFIGPSAPRRPDSLRARFEEIGPLLPLVHWNIEYLEASGVPVEMALKLLVEHDLLLHQIAEGGWYYSAVQRLAGCG